MAAVAFAVLSAFGFASTNVLMQLGLRGARVSSFTALLINLVGASVTLLIAIPLLGQAANFAAIHRIGATRTACFVQSDNLFAALLAFVVLGQTVSLLAGVGIAVLMAGAIAFIRETMGPGNGSLAADKSTSQPALFGIAMAVVSGLCFAVAGILRGLGVAAMPAAITGSAINNVSALLVMALVYAFSGRLREPFTVSRRQGAYLLLSGAATAVGTAGFILALQYGGTIAVSTALKNASPLFTFLLALILLQRHERLSFRLGLMVCLVVAGGVLTAMG